MLRKLTYKMQSITKGISILVIMFGASQCQTDTRSRNQNEKKVPEQYSYEGVYVDKGYANRNAGDDWVGVIISVKSGVSWHVSIRSRADIKKPTCTFDADLIPNGEHSLKATVDGKNILFDFDKDTLDIQAEHPEDMDLLHYYCSGGGSLSGKYQKINDPLDSTQVDKIVFNKTLSLQNITFLVSTTFESGKCKLYIQPSGLKLDNPLFVESINDPVKEAEIEDLNADGYPELLIYTLANDLEKRQHVIGYSVNSGKSLSRISIPENNENLPAFKDFKGSNEFAIVENRLVQRFRLFQTGDKVGNPTGKFRQISYKLMEGESSRRFMIDKITEFPAY